LKKTGLDDARKVATAIESSRPAEEYCDGMTYAVAHLVCTLPERAYQSSFFKTQNKNCNGLKDFLKAES